MALLSAVSSSPGPWDEGLGVVGFCVVDDAAAAATLRLVSVMACGVRVWRAGGGDSGGLVCAQDMKGRT